MIVLLPGESFSWGAGSLYDGSLLAAYGQVLVVTLNARLGVLGKYQKSYPKISRRKHYFCICPVLSPVAFNQPIQIAHSLSLSLMQFSRQMSLFPLPLSPK